MKRGDPGYLKRVIYFERGSFSKMLDEIWTPADDAKEHVEDEENV